MSDRPEYHQSQLNMFLKCGLQYQFRYMEGLRTPPTAALTVGSSVDAAVTWNLIKKASGEPNQKLDDVKDVYSSDFNARARDTHWGDEDAGKQKDIGLQCVEAHHEIIAPKIEPETIQERFVIETDAGYNLGGTIDIVEKDTTVADTKTSKIKYSPDAIFRAIQPAIYTFGYEALRGKKPRAFRYDVLIKPTKTIGVRTQQVESPVTTEDHEWLFDSLTRMDKAIKAGVFLPASENSWWCTKKWCGYAHMCKFKQR